jgi:N-acetylglutamate synthase-like GNAT family acetyltransferase
MRLDLCTIMNIHVDEKLRKKGRGTRLVRYVEALALQKGCKKMRANAIKVEAKEFFEKCGYQLTQDEGGEYSGERRLVE